MGAVGRSKVNVKPSTFVRGYDVYPGRQEAEALGARRRIYMRCMPNMLVPLVQSAPLDRCLWTVSGKKLKYQ